MAIPNLNKIKNLIPTIIQDYLSNKVLMLGYINKEALEKTIKEGYVCFWSRSRKRLWRKGKESGNKLKVKQLSIDCDDDTLLIKVELLGKNVCHKGYKSCFYKRIL